MRRWAETFRLNTVSIPNPISASILIFPPLPHEPFFYVVNRFRHVLYAVATICSVVVTVLGHWGYRLAVNYHKGPVYVI